MALRLPQDPVLKKRLKRAMSTSYLRSLPVSERQQWMKAAKECRTIDDLPLQMQIHLLQSEEEHLEGDESNTEMDER